MTKLFSIFITIFYYFNSSVYCLKKIEVKLDRDFFFGNQNNYCKANDHDNVNNHDNDNSKESHWLIEQFFFSFTEHQKKLEKTMESGKD